MKLTRYTCLVFLLIVVSCVRYDPTNTRINSEEAKNSVKRAAGYVGQAVQDDTAPREYNTCDIKEFNIDVFANERNYSVDASGGQRCYAQRSRDRGRPVSIAPQFGSPQPLIPQQGQAPYGTYSY